MKIIAILLLLLTCASCYNCEESMEKLRKEEFTCYVKSIKSNVNNRNVPTVFLDCPSNHETMYFDRYEFPTLYTYAEIGDTVSKTANSWEFIIKKKDTNIVFRAVCGGTELR